MPRVCAFNGCNNTVGGGRSFFILPKNERRREEWLRHARIEVLTKTEPERGGYVFCSDHFRPEEIKCKGQRKRLVLNAVPALYEQSTPALQEKRGEDMPSQCTYECKMPVDFHTLLAQKNKKIKEMKILLKKEKSKLRVFRYRANNKIKDLQLQVSKLQPHQNTETYALTTECLPKEAKEFVDGQIAMAQMRSRGQRYTKKQKDLAIRLYHHSPACYLELKNTFQLPAPVTLIRHLMDSLGSFEPGFLHGVLAKLKAKAETMAKEEKNCAIVIDEMAIKNQLDYNRKLDCIDGLAEGGKMATRATVFVVRAINGKWKQAIGYFLSMSTMAGEEIAAKLRETVAYLESSGLNVKCVVCGQGPTNEEAMRILGASLDINEDGDVSHCIDIDKKIPLIFDVPHLVKSIRNNLKQHPINIQGNEVSWKYLQDFYIKDRKGVIRLAPKLTASHIYLPPSSNIRVNLATQIFSHSVAAGMQTMVLQHQLQKDALHTAKFAEDMDRLFDVLNSRMKDSKWWRRPLGTDSNRLDYLQNCISWIKSWKFGSTRPPPCRTGLVLSIRSILKLYQELMCEGVKYLCTSTLNKDYLENLFSGKGGQQIYPTVRELATALMNGSAAYILGLPESATNYFPADGTQLLQCSHARSTEQSEQEPEPEDVVYNSEQSIPCVDVVIDADDAMDMQKGKQEVLAYVAGWVTSKVAEDPELGQCWECHHALVKLNHMEHGYSTVSREGSLINDPSTLLRNCIVKCESIIEQTPPEIWAAKGLTKRLKEALQCGGAFSELHTQHPTHSKAIEKVALNKFVMCRIGAELRARNQVTAEIKKRKGGPLKDATARKKLACLNATK
ncbi:uncharacterized protein LOC121682290 isoform X1 [Alosa sapidissima]|uniref:uncharacterized protein LOC121682290 isoform X1 n=1 Tax=Alosa sapidissima TaxID=34773 RepID=UPI001C0A21FE|nr:uncharacterized protein LOC121682290 isoform X1 [Alosa sapidissima]